MAIAGVNNVYDWGTVCTQEGLVSSLAAPVQLMANCIYNTAAWSCTLLYFLANIPLY